MAKHVSLRFHPARPRRCALLCAAALAIGATLGVTTPAMAADPGPGVAPGSEVVPTQAIDLCAQMGAKAGFPRNQSLVTAVAVGMAESGCNNSAAHRNAVAEAKCTGRSGTVDYGLWQINICIHPQFSLKCVKDPLCNAQAAYQISSRGTNFRPWVSYREGHHRRFLAEARAAVNRLPR